MLQKSLNEAHQSARGGAGGAGTREQGVGGDGPLLEVVGGVEMAQACNAFRTPLQPGAWIPLGLPGASICFPQNFAGNAPLLSKGLRLKKKNLGIPRD